MYYLNKNYFYSNNVVFAYACMHCLSQVNMDYVYLAYKCIRHRVYT